jgi:branched-chain amino acid transport system ATP-binding protein
MSSSEAFLEASGIAMRFGGVHVLADVSMQIQAGETVGIIGPNGAGKTTLFNIFSGFLRPTKGKLYYGGKDIGALMPFQRSRLGLMRTWQLPRAFRTMTVRENVLVSATASGERIANVSHRTDGMLGMLGLEAYRDMQAVDLPPGQRRRLELARALVSRPRLLLLDEVLSGQTVAEVDALFDILKRLVHDDGLTLVMIEHVIRAVRTLCDRVVVLADGRVLAQGVPDEVIARPEVVHAYVGASRESTSP